MTNFFSKILILSSFLLVIISQNAVSQPELQAWGNMSGIRIDGQLMKFETSIQVVKNDWKKILYKGKEKQRKPIYKRETEHAQVTLALDKVSFTSLMTK